MKSHSGKQTDVEVFLASFSLLVNSFTDLVTHFMIRSRNFPRQSFGQVISGKNRILKLVETREMVAKRSIIDVRHGRKYASDPCSKFIVKMMESFQVRLSSWHYCED